MIGTALAAFTATTASFGMQPAAEPISELCSNFYIFFDANSDRVTLQAAAIIDNWIAMTRMVEAPYNRYFIEGGADVGEPDARDLSFRRGRAVMRYSIARGLPADRFVIRSVGARPLGEEASQAENRRANLSLATTVSNWRRVHGDVVC